MGSILRLVLGVPVAALIVIAIFIGMYELIKPPEEQEIEDNEPPNIQLGRQIEDSAVVDQRRFEKPVLDEPPPPPPAINQETFQPTVEGVRAEVPTFEANVDIGTAFNPDRDAQPLVRIPPSNWERCIDRDDFNESVRVRFNVTPEGQTTDIEVVASTDSCLNRSAIRSVQRWRYQPKIVDGNPEPRFGVETTIRFQVGE